MCPADTTVTTRDRVWDAALRVAAGRRLYSTFTTGDVLEEAGLGEPERRTAQRTLKAMVELGWLSDSGTSWRVIDTKNSVVQ